jgi:hypothetical protein
MTDGIAIPSMLSKARSFPEIRRGRRSTLLLGSFQSDSAPATLAGGPIRDQLDAGSIEGANQFHQRIHIPTDDILARLHPLDRRDGQAAKLRQLTLIDPDQRSGRAQLSSCDH